MSSSDFEYGLGASPSPPDSRDFALALAPLSAPLPRRFVCTGMGPVLNQGSLPQCVAYAHTGMKLWQEKRDGHGILPFDPNWLYWQCKALDGNDTPGTSGRQAMRVLKDKGEALLGHPEAALHFRIDAYYSAPLDPDNLKQAISQYGPITVGGEWYRSWFRPNRGVIDGGTGGVAGGHEVLIFGWDEDVAGGSLLIRNSWGIYPGSVNGNFYAPYRTYIPKLWEAWKSLDVVGD